MSNWREELLKAKRIAFDIEIWNSERLACVGFAASPDRAYVFSAATQMKAIREILESPVPKIAQNGAFDLHFLLTRCGIHVNAYQDDTLIAWHACWPELAGASHSVYGERKGKRTHKSLAFFGSLFTRDAWWKGEYENEREFFEYNGKDCCITFDVMQQLDREIECQGVRETYEREISLVWPCVEMQARGLHIDDALRRSRISAIEARIADDDARLEELVLPLLRERLDELSPEVRAVFEHSRQCTCCGGGKLARSACWRCAGYTKKPGKRALAAGRPLVACEACAGEGALRWLEFNGRSVPQKQALLYEVLRLPKRYKRVRVKGKPPREVLSTDEDAMRGLLANIGAP